MNVLDVTAEVLDVLNSRNVGYMLVGSLSTNLHGMPRNTNDADGQSVVSGPRMFPMSKVSWPCNNHTTWT